MKKVAVLILFALLFAGCQPVKQERPAIRIDGIEVTSQEFEQAFNSSQFAKQGPEGRKKFLEVYIQRKLILKEAERLNLDKVPQFLNDIQLFWEQSLLKLILTKQINHISAHTRVDDKEIEEYYQKNKPQLFPDKQLPEVYEQIKLLLFKEKQTKAMQSWSDSLKKRANIEIDYKSLGIKEQ